MPGKFRPHSGAVTAEAVSHHSEDLQVFHLCQEISLGHPVAFIQKRDPVNADETAQHMLLSARCTCICMFAESAYCAFVVNAACGPHRTSVCGKTEKMRHVLVTSLLLAFFDFLAQKKWPLSFAFHRMCVPGRQESHSEGETSGGRPSLRQSRDRAQVAPSGQKQYCTPADRPYLFSVSHSEPIS